MSNENQMGIAGSEILDTNAIAKQLLATPFYSKMGAEGLYAIVGTAQALGVDARLALSGGLYYVRGKVEMSSRMMNALIRSKKHSITRDKKSDETICILHGKRSDNGDTWTASFSIDEARRAGLTTNKTWENWCVDMLFARALSRLARQLFPDVIGNCYVEGELSEEAYLPVARQVAIPKAPDSQAVPPVEYATEEEIRKLLDILDAVPEYKKKVESFLTKKGIQYTSLPKELYKPILIKAEQEVKSCAQ